MLKILKKLALSNVVSFNLSDNEPILAAYASGLHAKTSRKMQDIKKTQRLEKANRYLAKQFKRLERLSSTDPIGFDYLSLKLMQKSVVYRMYAISKVCPEWISMRLEKVTKLERAVKKLTNSLATDIDYKRVWIDKKPGDYGRPLGVPTMAWRIYLRMITNIAEIYSLGKGYYSPIQHGGRPEMGVMTCLKAVAEKLTKYENVYEFDLKGFFDHISIQSIVSKFQDIYLGDLFDQLLRSSPKGFKLPPIEVDKAALKYQAIKDMEFEEDWGVRTQDAEDLGFKYTNYDQAAFEGLTWEQAQNLVSFEEEAEWDAIIAKNLKPLNIRGTYKDLMNDLPLTKRYGNSLSELSMDEIDEDSRASGRDNWKELDLPNQGVPQGTSFGPFLASLLIGKRLEEIPNSLIYLDDGLCFFNTEAELANIKAKLPKIISDIGVEIAPEKSGVITKTMLLTQGVKFLGTRMKGVRNFFTIASETRSGTIRELPALTQEKIYDILTNMKEAGLITPSKYNLAKWTLFRSKINELYKSPVLDASIKYNFFGYLLSWLYNPEMDINEMKHRIQEGTKIAEAKIRNSKGSIGKGIMNLPTYEYKAPGGTFEIVRPTLYNASTLCLDLFLETYEYGNVSLREFGLENKVVSDPYYTLAINFNKKWNKSGR